MITIRDLILFLKAVKIRDKLKEKLVVIGAIHQAEVNKVIKLEKKILKTRMLLMILWALIVGSVAASLIN